MYSKNIFSRLAAAILCGGKSKRMGGKDKAFIEINGEPIIQRTIGLLKGIFEEVILVTNSRLELRFDKDVMITQDLIKDIGPLGGIYSALCRTSKKGVFFVACDMPFLHNDAIVELANRFEGVDCQALIPRIGSLIEPLHGIYKMDIKDEMRNFIGYTNDYSIRGFLNTINVHYLDLEDNILNRNIFQNINSEEDLVKAQGALCR